MPLPSLFHELTGGNITWNGSENSGNPHPPSRSLIAIRRHAQGDRKR